MTERRPIEAPIDRPIRLAVLISGGGTTLVNLVNKMNDGSLQAEIPLVIASRTGCGGIERCRELNLRCEIIPRKAFEDVESFSEEVFRLVRESRVDLVVCGGFLSLLTVPDDFTDRVINIHPSLIPAFCGWGYYGHRVHEAALERGVKVSGCTVHFVDNQYDHGPIILQKVVPVLDGDTPDLLAARVFAAECDALPEGIRQFASGRLKIANGTVVSDRNS
jgi:phosphoribosylglycinamide formyltransferase 1